MRMNFIFGTNFLVVLFVQLIDFLLHLLFHFLFLLMLLLQAIIEFLEALYVGSHPKFLNSKRDTFKDLKRWSFVIVFFPYFSQMSFACADTLSMNSSV